MSTSSLHIYPEKWDRENATEFLQHNFQIFDSQRHREVTIRVTSNFNSYVSAYPWWSPSIRRLSPLVGSGFPSQDPISVQFRCSVVSNSLWPHGLQFTRLPCPSPSPGAYSNLCPSSWWCHPTISFSVISSSSCLQSFPASGSFPTSQFFASGSQSIRASSSVLPMNIQDWLPLAQIDWLDLLAVQGTLKSLLQHHSSKASILEHSAFFMVQLSHPYVTTGKIIALTRQTLVGKLMSLLFNALSRLGIVFLPRS